MVVGESGLGKSTLINSLFLTDLYPDRVVREGEKGEGTEQRETFGEVVETKKRKEISLAEETTIFQSLTPNPPNREVNKLKRWNFSRTKRD